MKQILSTILLLTLGLTISSQTLQPIAHDYYIPPVKIPIFLAGNFAELRPNHFHAGIDIKTQGKIGIPVYAAAEGYISRIAITPSGYGNVLYINHPNGTSTVYGHLNSFSPKIEEYIRKLQYEKETFSIDQIVPEGLIPVAKDEQIAKSGNAGSSGGPHLHFEIRRTQEQIMLNPLLYIPVKDKTKPIIQALMVYPVSEDASISGKQTPQRLEVILSGDEYLLKNKQTITVSGEIGFGIQAIDLLDGSANKCGIYSIKLIIDNELIYSFSMDKYVLDESRYINSHMDYEYALRTGKRFYRTWKEPGNKLSIYDPNEKEGIFKATDGKIHQVKYEVADLNGNTTNLEFQIEAKDIQVSPREIKGELFKYNHKNHIKDDDIVFTIPEGALYNNIDFIYKKGPAIQKFYSPVYQLHTPYIPLHFACPLRIKATNLPVQLQDKAMLAQIDPATGRIFSATGKYVDGWIEGNIRVLGNYAIAVDTTAPKITLLSIPGKKPAVETNSISFKVTDNLSGIDTFRGTIDGQWVLFEYDAKNNLISYTFDKKRFQFNKNHVIDFSVTDFKGNTSTFNTKFYK